MTRATARAAGIFKAYDIRGLYGAEMDGDDRPRGRPRLRPRARRPAGEGARASCGSASAATCGSRRRRWRRRLRDGLIVEGATVIDAGMVAHRDALFPGRLARARRRRDGHRLAQPEGLHRGEAGPRGGAGALRRRRHRRRPRPRSRPGSADAPGRRHASRRSTSTTSSSDHALGFIDPAPSGRCGWSSTAATGWRGRWSARCSSASAST